MAASFCPEPGYETFTDASSRVVEVDAELKRAVRRADAVWLAVAEDSSESEEVRRAASELVKHLSAT